MRLERTREALAIADRKTDAFAAALDEVEQAEAALAACDTYVNWHEPRIVPTEAIPDRDAAFYIARSALAAFGSGEGDTA